MDKENYYQVCVAYERAVRNLNYQAWMNMYDNEKIADLQAIENYNAMQQGRESAIVRGEVLDTETWGYQIGNSIVINSAHLSENDFWEHVDTIFHEGSHMLDDAATVDENIRAQFSDNEYRDRHTAIPDPDIDPDGYFNHPAEVAARLAGNDGVRETIVNQEKINGVDELIRNDESIVNQILTSHEYVALDTSFNQILHTQMTEEVSLPTGEREVLINPAFDAMESDVSETVNSDMLTDDVDEDIDCGVSIDNGMEMSQGL